MPINENQHQKIWKELNRLSAKIAEFDTIPLEETREEIKALTLTADTLDKMVTDHFQNLSKRLNEERFSIEKLTTATNALLQLMKDQRDLFQKSMLWISGVFSGMHYISASEGLQMIIGESKEGE